MGPLALLVGLTSLVPALPGDLLYRGATEWRRLPGQTSATVAMLTQTGDGVNSAKPVWRSVLSLSEQASTPAAVADTAILFTQDVGGKTQLLVLFPTGAAIVLSTEL